ncbi:MAG: cytochrome c oxidase assembly protein [Corynebacterium sp.]|nr:cytochrome c oxidase assembly protein [Corynebacterium sp.]
MKARQSTLIYAIIAAVAGVVAMVISGAFLNQSLAALGIPDPGLITTAGLPFVRGLALILACLAGGQFLLAAFLIPPADERDYRHSQLSVDQAIAVRTGTWALVGFAIVAFLLMPMYLSDVSGSPLSETIVPDMWAVAYDQVSTSLAFFWAGVIALIVAGFAFFARHWMSLPGLFVGAYLVLVPLGLEGHSAAGGNHDYGTNSYLVHLLFTQIWVGGLIALIALARRKGAGLGLATQRYSRLALIAVIAMAVTGVVNAIIRVAWADVLTSGYGRLIVAKAVLLVALGFFGYLHRARTIPQLDSRPGLFVRLAVVEVVVMAAVVGLAISLQRTPPPPPVQPDINSMDILVGYKLFIAPTFWNLWTMWRYDLVFGSLGIILAALYLIAVRAHGSWPIVRTLWFLAGCATLTVTMSSGIGMYIPVTFSIHMVGHMILSMGVPVLWVLGGPLTLIIEAYPGTDLAKWTEALTQAKFLTVLMHPGINTIQFVLIYYILYLTPLYSMLVWEHAGHLGMNVIFLLSGTIYYWGIVGIDPQPHEHSPMVKSAYLFFSLPFHMYFGVYLMQLQKILAEDFYTRLGMPWNPDLLFDQRIGGSIAWGAGMFPLIIVFGALLYQWLQSDRKEAAEHDEREAATGGEDYNAYNEYLAAIQRGENPDAAYYETELTRRR